MVTRKYYKNILKKDLILKVIPEQPREIPAIDKLQVQLIFPKVVDDFYHIFEGIIYLEELTGQFPIKKILSKKRIGAQEYEKSVLLKVTLRKNRIYNFILYLTIALLFYWEESRNVLVFKASCDPQNNIVQLSNKEFFYFFNMPIEYDDRQFQWNLQLLFYFKKYTQEINNDLLNYFLSHYLPYSLFKIKSNKRKN